jgi:fructuronate reductase
MSERLSPAVLDRLPAEVSMPRYDRDRAGVGIVHLGIGAFHRGHQAWYTERAMNLKGGDWCIAGVSLRSGSVRDQLVPQSGLYTLVTREGTHSEYQVVGAVKEVLVAPESPGALVDRLADPRVRVVTLTITEKGYTYSAADQGLNMTHPEVLQDIAGYPSAPVTAVGFLAAGLSARLRNGAGGITLLSCDNLPHNGRVLESVVRDFVARTEPGLLGWIDENVSFPSSMVDRIVPASTANDLASLDKTLGCSDHGAVFTEPFCQWVIEDRFANGAPDWKSAGAILTDDVTPFETMKLRLLNGSHSLLAYLGFMAGYDYVHQAIADSLFRQLVRRFMDSQVQPTLVVPEGFDIEAYKEQLCQRFANSALNHRLYQIAQDGSQKIPQRWISPMRDLLKTGLQTNVLCLLIAGWIHYLSGHREDGMTFVVDDPLFPRLETAIAGGDIVRAVLQVEEIFSALATDYPAVVEEIDLYYQVIARGGIRAAIRECIGESGP